MTANMQESAANVADAAAVEAEAMGRKHPEHVLKFARDCVVAQKIAVGIRALPADHDPTRSALEECAAALLKISELRKLKHAGVWTETVESVFMRAQQIAKDAHATARALQGE